MTTNFAFIGLLATVIGSGLLVIYGVPRKKIGNVMVYGSMALISESESMDMPESEWKRKANSYQKRCMLLNKSGFLLIVLGTILQMYAL